MIGAVGGYMRTVYTLVLTPSDPYIPGQSGVQQLPPIGQIIDLS